jgi:hypothetical protein
MGGDYVGVMEERKRLEQDQAVEHRAKEQCERFRFRYFKESILM